MIVQERYVPLVVGVNTTLPIQGQAVMGFLPVTTGTLTITTQTGVVIVNAVPLTAGVFVRLPFYLDGNGGTVTTAGGASGTLAYG